MIVFKNIRNAIGLSLASLALTASMFFLVPPHLAGAQGTPRVQVLQSDVNRVVVELTVAGYTTQSRNVDAGTFTILTVHDFGHTGETGKPELPIKGVMIGIPPGAEPALRIIADDSRRDSLANPPIPAPTAQIDSQPRENTQRFAGNSFIPDQTVYNSNRLFPTNAARIASTGNWRSQRYIVVDLYPLQYNPATRELVFHRRLQVEITFTYPRGRTAQTLGGPIKEGPFEQILQKSLLNYSSAQNWRSKVSAVTPRTRQPREYSGGPWFKIAVKTDGIYKVTCTSLRDAGFAYTSLNSDTLQLFDQGFEPGKELAIRVVGSTWTTCTDNDYIEFYGQPLNTEYTDTNVYWLTYGGATGKRMPTRSGNVAGAVPATFTDTVHLEQNKTYFSWVPMNVENADHWYWEDAAWFYPNPTFSFQLDRYATSIYSATLRYVMGGRTLNNHHTRVYVNGNLIDDAVWNGQIEHNSTIPFSQAFLQAGTNTIRINEVNDLDQYDMTLVNYFDLNYQSSFTASTDSLRFKQEAIGTWQFQIGGFTNSTIEAFDITDPYSVTRIIDTNVTGGPVYTLQFGDSITTPHTYITLTSAQRKLPESITLDMPPPSSLHSTLNGADYIVVSYGGFIPNIQPLADFRATQGLRVKVVDVQDIYDEFSDGSLDTQAIRDFLAFAYNNWQVPAPSFVLLVGDATYDPRRYCATPGFCWLGAVTPPNSTFIPPYLRMVDPWNGETVSDNRLVSFNDGSGNTLPFMAIGRLPANNPTEVDAMVSKILNYEQNPPSGNWRSTITFVTDNSYNSSGVLDNAGDFWGFSDAIASNSQYMPSGLIADRIYLNLCDPNLYPQCALPYPSYPTGASARSALNSAINSGRLIVSYIGHASYNLWAGETIYNTGEISTLANGAKLPVVLAMTCLDGYFLNPGFPSMAETFLRASNKGAVASWSATGLGVAHGHDFLEKGFFNAVMNDSIRRLGPATVAGKINLWINSGGSYHDLIDTYALFGDPASWLQIQFQSYLPFIRK